MLNFLAVGVPLLMFAGLVGYIIGMGVRERRVYCVTEGETYYEAWIVHGIFSDYTAACEYARDITERNGSVRWPNTAVVTFEMDKPGFLKIEDVKL